MRLIILLVCSLVPWYVSVALAGAAPESESLRLKAWLDAQYEQELLMSPTTLTRQGRRERYAEIDDMSEAGLDQQLQWLQDSVSELEKTFDYEQLTHAGQVSYDFWRFRLQQAQALRPYRRHSYVFEQSSGQHTFPASFLINLHRVDSVGDMEAYIARIAESARALRQLLTRAQLAAADGIRAPRFTYRLVIEQSRRIISGEPFEKSTRVDSDLWADVTRKITALADAGKLNKAQSSTLLEQARVALTTELQPAYQQLITWFEDDIKNTSEQAAGVEKLPSGKSYYQSLLADYTHSSMKAAQIHALGLEQVARIHAEIDQLREQVGFEGTLQDFFQFIRDDEQFYVPDTDAGRQTYIDTTTRVLDAMNDRLSEYFNRLPKASLVVKRVEPFREQAGAAAFYQDGTADGSRPGVYYLHLSDMSAMNTTDLETTAYHEGNPGHHMQGSIAQEVTELPEFRRHIWYSAYGEGWALYAEYLGKEMGAFEDPYSDVGRLVAELWRAIRLVVDTGLHSMGWSQQQAIDYMVGNSSIPEATVNAEIQRYLVIPGQATSYMVGMLKILELRAAADAGLGEEFDIRSFHDLVLAGGSLPLPILDRVVADWIQQQQGEPVKPSKQVDDQ